VSEQGTTRVSLSLSPDAVAVEPMTRVDAPRKKPRYWIYGVVGGAVVVAVALGVGLGVGLSNSSGIPTLPVVKSDRPSRAPL